jgi:hypothetical protein
LITNNMSYPFTNPNNHSSIIDNQIPTINLNRPADNDINSLLLPNQTLTFNSQALTRVPPQTKTPTHRNPRASTHKRVTTRPAPQAISDPPLIRTRPEKKPKNPQQTQTRPKPNLTNL